MGIGLGIILLVIGLANPEAWVAGQNSERYKTTGKLDLHYLASLGVDAAPTIADGLPEDLSRCILGDADSALGDDLLEWNLGRARAAALTTGASAAPPVGQPGCPRTIGE